MAEHIRERGCADDWESTDARGTRWRVGEGSARILLPLGVGKVGKVVRRTRVRGRGRCIREGSVPNGGIFEKCGHCPEVELRKFVLKSLKRFIFRKRRE